MKKISTLLIVFTCFIANAQVSEQWQKYYNEGVNVSDNGIELVIDKMNNIYTIVTSFRSSNSSIASSLIKYNEDGDTIWLREIEYSAWDQTIYKDIVIDTTGSGSIYVVGELNLNSLIPNSKDAFIRKYNLDGDTIWTKQFNGPQGLKDNASKIVLDDFGDPILGGFSTKSGSVHSLLTIKFNKSNGDTIWTRYYNGNSSALVGVTDIEADTLGNIYVVGDVFSGDRNIALVKYNSSGTQMWASEIDGTNFSSDDYNGQIAIDNTGAPVLCGSITNTSSSVDILLAKFNSITGDTLWTRINTSSGSAQDYATNVQLDDNNNIYLAGREFLSGMDYKLILFKYRPSGNFVWSASYMAPGALGNGVLVGDFIIDRNNNSYITGTNRNSSPNSIFTIKFDSLGTELWSTLNNGSGAGGIGNALAIDNNKLIMIGIDYGIVYNDFIIIKYCDNLPVYTISIDTSMCNGDTIQLSATGGATYAWSPSTGLDDTTLASPSTNASADIVYYSKIFAPDGCWVQDSIDITVNSLPTPAFSGSNINNFAPLSSNFSDLTGGIIQWLWDFGDPVSAGLNTSINPNPTHIFNSIDTFDITMTVWNINNCKASLTKTAFVKVIPASVSGYIFKEVLGDTIKSGKVLLLDKNKPLNNPDTTDIQTDGSYNFPFTTLGEYYILAKPNAATYVNSIPTYFGNEVEWFNSTFLVLTNNSSNNNILTDTVSPTAGPGNIVGTVRQGPASNFGKVQGIGDPFNGVDVSLIDKSTGSAIAHDISDSSLSNELDLNNLPAGNYTVYVDVTGVPLDASMDITVSSSNNSLSLDIIVDSNLIYLGTTSITGLNEALVSYKEQLSIYPNPVTDVMFFSFGLQKSSNIQLSIVDNLGRQVDIIVEGQYNKGAYSFNKNINTLKLSNGIYFVKLLIDEKTITSKFIYTKK